MKKIGIIGAMDEEVRELTSELENKKTRNIAGLNFNEGILHGKDVVVVECGIAKVNAAMCTQILISEFGVDAVINTGVAGALYDELKINDIVISTDSVQYDVDASAAGEIVGTIPRMDTSVFKADERLIDIAYDAFLEEKTEFKAYKGRVVTGDQFVADKEKKEYLKREFGGYCCEMEGAAMAHVAHCNNIPFVIIRAISDNADSSADKSYEEFVEKAATTSKKMVDNILKRL
ncbi:5'-methylthioadenosine/adenosylhomocysteine nucleosidase [Peptostreptococcus faecalis]|uniref:5'-methylthioadenosine/adenosylhomocysteine nucleosidase n=1 Tax=Peptostreptococcus faecalis TaxID=2045015 RepID=UPI000C7A05DD|nr:5'-methylthioadenosine/adenosylhomocysteine nucleosidase [Peptostreptococcus faecalis]